MPAANRSVFYSGEQPIDVSWITWWFLLPPPLTRGNPTAWSIPQYKAPSHCLKIQNGEAGDLNAGFLQQKNHPCTFLRKGIAFPETLALVVPSREAAAA